ncbi:MAG: hypothetical protein ACI9XU_000591 [Arenicella sp.]|jgi:hypothetical protein
MTVEIRELIIKTEIKSSPEMHGKLTEEELKVLKQQILEHCKRILKSDSRNNRHDR